MAAARTAGTESDRVSISIDHLDAERGSVELRDSGLRRRHLLYGGKTASELRPNANKPTAGASAAGLGSGCAGTHTPKARPDKGNREKVPEYEGANFTVLMQFVAELRVSLCLIILRPRTVFLRAYMWPWPRAL
eukprot:SAG31_NODE_12626_length_928_cov_4.898673_1_plen_134_part_00